LAYHIQERTQAEGLGDRVSRQIVQPKGKDPKNTESEFSRLGLLAY